MTRHPGLLAAALLLACTPASHESAAARPAMAHDSCRFTSADSAWTAAAIQGWHRQVARGLRAPTRVVPSLVLFDERCSHTLVPVAAGARASFVAGAWRFVSTDVAHEGSVPLPDGSRIPAQLVSFAAPDSSGGVSFVMALPAIWRSSRPGPQSELLATAVFMHEFAHTQAGALTARVDMLVSRGLPQDVTDDVVQHMFAERPGFRAAYEAERDLLFRAAGAPTREAAAELAARALELIDRRRAAFFAGGDSLFAPAEDLFLTLEGTGQWAAYLWLTDPAGGDMSPDEALPFVRRGGRRWSQDEGLALALVLARLDPGWSARVFADRPETVLGVLRSTLAARPLR
ncbi:MAG TPA: hypothetical protein VFS05_03175 [Gemmatimonadaceae bacterium]|nr:hypothetical protein [Gemmatimonadaceae bacterium]